MAEPAAETQNLFFLSSSPLSSLVFLGLQFVSRHLVLHGRLSFTDAAKQWPDEGAVFSFMLCDRALLPSAVSHALRCAFIIHERM